jgi:hypothetical protein
LLAGQPSKANLLCLSNTQKFRKWVQNYLAVMNFLACFPYGTSELPLAIGNWLVRRFTVTAMFTKENRCWPGYEPVKDKPEHSQGSCKPKAKSKPNKGEKQFRAKREEQLSAWKEAAPGNQPKSGATLEKARQKIKVVRCGRGHEGRLTFEKESSSR